MTKHALDVPFTVVSVDRRSPTPFNVQLFMGLRDAIRSGRLSAGVRLPSTRKMAAELGLSRNTVLNVFEQLHAEGYIEARSRSGSYVAHVLPDDSLIAPRGAAPVSPMESRTPTVSRRGSLFAAMTMHPPAQPPPRAFQPGLAAVDLFPVQIWRKLQAARWRRAPHVLLRYGSPAGYRPLREAIAAYLGATRGVLCDPDQIIVVAGTQQGLSLATQVLTDPGDRAWIEDPGYVNARIAFEAAGLQLTPVSIDAEGINLEEAATREPAPKLVYVTPSHQFPLGVVMTTKRRLALLEWAHLNDVWILEDDYDSELRYTGRPETSLQGLDEHGRVIYFGTFSKVFFPSLRLGYMIVPPTLVDPVVAAQRVTNGFLPLMDQAVLADFLFEGYFARHVRRMRTAYAERQAALVAAAHETLVGLLNVNTSPAGMHLVGWLNREIDDRAAARACAERGVQALPLSLLRLEPSGSPGGLVLGYAAVTPTEIREGVARMRSGLQAALSDVSP